MFPSVTRDATRHGLSVLTNDRRTGETPLRLNSYAAVQTGDCRRTQPADSGRRADLQRRFSAWNLVVDYHAGFLDRHGRPVRMAVPLDLCLHRLLARQEEERGSRLTGRPRKIKDAGLREATCCKLPAL